MVYSCRFTHLMGQSATFTHFRTLITHFDLFGLRPKKCRFIKDPVFLRKKVVSST